MKYKIVAASVIGASVLAAGAFVIPELMPDRKAQMSWDDIPTAPAPAPVASAQPEAATPETADANAPLLSPTSRIVLDSEDPVVDENADLWALYAAGELSELSAAIVSRQEADPQWVVPAELEEKLALLEETERLLNAGSLKQYDMVLSILTATPELLVCERPDAIWAASEAVYKVRGHDEGRTMIERNLSDCISDETLRQETALRTGDFMTAEDIAAVRDSVADPSLEDAFLTAEANADLRLIGAWVAEATFPTYVRPGDETAPEAAEGATPVVRGTERAPIPGGTVFSTDPTAVYVLTQPVPDATRAVADRLIAGVEALGPEQVEVLAWYAYAAGDPRTAADLFERVRLSENPTPEILRGETLALIAYEDYVRAEALLPTAEVSGWDKDDIYLIAAAELVGHADRDIEDVLYREGLSLDATQAGRIQSAALATKDWDLSEKLGWHSHRVAGCGPALPWWRMTLETRADFEPAAYGIAMCLANAKDGAEAQALRATWSSKSTRIAQIFGDAQEIVSSPRPRARPTTLGTGVYVATASYDASGPRVIVAGSVPRDMPAPAPAPVAQQAAPVAAPVPQPVRRTAEAAPARQAAPQQSARSAAPCEAPLSSLNAGDALAQGWCMMERGNLAVAAAAFEKAMSSSTGSVRSDAAYGKSLISLRQGDYAAAQAEIARAPQPQSRQGEIAAAALAAQAQSTFSRRRSALTIDVLDERAKYAEETPDLMTLRGWALWRANKPVKAREAWQAAADMGYEPAKKALRDTWN